MTAERQNPDPAHSPQVPFDSGCLGVLLVFFVPFAALMTVAVVDSEFVASLAGREVRRNLFAAIAPLRIGSINIGAAVLAVILGWETLRIARRFISRRAVWIDGDMIRFHPTVHRRAVPLGMLEAISHETGEIKSVLRLTHSGAKRIIIRAVDHDAAAAFVGQAERAKAALTFG